MAFIQYSAFYDFYKAGKAKILAVASVRRLPDLPEIPSMTELGYPQIVGVFSPPFDTRRLAQDLVVATPHLSAKS